MVKNRQRDLLMRLKNHIRNLFIEHQKPDMKITYLKGSEQIKQFMEKRKKTDVK